MTPAQPDCLGVKWENPQSVQKQEGFNSLSLSLSQADLARCQNRGPRVSRRRAVEQEAKD